MMDDLDKRKWARFLNLYARRVNPWVKPGNRLKMFDYYWTTRQSEYATDVMFRDEAALAAVYPSLADHAIRHFHSRDVMRFLGRRTNIRFSGQVHSQLGYRCEGMRVKHWVEENSIKMYDKEGCVLRIETTINNPRRLQVRRTATHKGHADTRLGFPCVKAWLTSSGALKYVVLLMGYIEALGVVGEPSPTRQLLDPVSKRITRRGRPYRALRPIDPEEAKLFAVLTDGKFLLQGFRNADLRKSSIAGPKRTLTNATGHPGSQSLFAFAAGSWFNSQSHWNVLLPNH